jgi:hypothetical protein
MQHKSTHCLRRSVIERRESIPQTIEPLAKENRFGKSNICAVIPQFVAGALWAYVRPSDDLLRTMVLHPLKNFVPFVLIDGFGLEI